MATFRFMNLDIWKEAIALNDTFFELADILSESRSYRVAEQLRAASLSISNNIAEGSGSYSDKDFANFLNYARRSAFECANIMCVLFNRKIISKEQLDENLNKLDILSRKISNFRKTLLKT
ncbi:four helix bundle protein [Labilibacter marinus]|uniref:four helix bundle protein n=1 Tax=Labilibacter marinus TaxID=1477105 RepID=UPI0008323172|nr:four helix bundle protein [Labilibacter marinus]